MKRWRIGSVRCVFILVILSSVFLLINLYSSIYTIRYEESSLGIGYGSFGNEVQDTDQVIKTLEREISTLKQSLRSKGAVGHTSFKALRVYCMVPTMFSESKFESWTAILRSWGERCDIIKFFVDPVYEEDYPFHTKQTIRNLKLFQEKHNLQNTTKKIVYQGNNRVERTRVEVPKVFIDKETGLRADIVVIDMKRISDKGNEKHCWSGGRKDATGKPVYVRCKHIWEKVWRSWVYMHDTGLNDADYFFKVDDDTYFFPDFVKLHAAEHGWDPDEEHYFGHHLHHGRVETGFIAGAVVGYSRGTLRKVVPFYKRMPREYGDRSKFRHGRCVDRDGATQELAESKCLFDAGITAEDTRDINGFEKVSLHGVGEVLIMRKKPGTTYWFWSKKEKTAICCSTVPIAFHHYKSAQRMLRVHNLFFNLEYDFLMDLFSDFKKTKFVISNSTAPARKYITSEHISNSGSALGKYEEIQYILRVREMLELFDLYH